MRYVEGSYNWAHSQSESSYRCFVRGIRGSIIYNELSHCLKTLAQIIPPDFNQAINLGMRSLASSH